MGVVGRYLALLMAVALVGLIASFMWSRVAQLITLGPIPEVGLVRWLGAALAAAFTIVWLPLFPRVTSTLAGMIAGPALFAVLGYSFFGSYIQDSSPRSDGPALAAGMLTILATLLWMPGALWLSHRTRLGEVVRQGRRPLSHAVWSGALMLLLTAMGTDIEKLF